MSLPIRSVCADGTALPYRTDPKLDTQQRHVPFIEHFANTQDMVARLGVLERGLPVSGQVYTLEKAGHFLNAHYLLEIEASQAYAWHDADGKPHRTARLYDYLQGGTPELLPIEATPHPERDGRCVLPFVPGARMSPGLRARSRVCLPGNRPRPRPRHPQRRLLEEDSQ